MRIRATVLASLSIALTCCLGGFAANSRSQQDTPTNKSTVFIYFTPGEGSKSFAPDIAIDKMVVVHLRKGIVFKTLLDSGSHEFLVRGPVGKRYTFILEPGKDTYLRIAFRLSALGMWGRTMSRFELVTKEQGSLDISQGQLVPPDPQDLRPKKKK